MPGSRPARSHLRAPVRLLCALTGLAALAVPALVHAGADASTPPASKRTAYAPNVMFPVAGGRGVDLRTSGKRPGTEIKAGCGSTVRAATAGTAVVTSSPTAGPNLVRVVTSFGRLVTWYGFMQKATVTNGQVIQAGQPIGVVGHAGIARMCSLYFAVTSNSGATTYNPTRWLNTYVGKPVPSTSLFDNNGFVLATFNTLGASHTKNSSRYATYDVRTPRQVALLARYGVDVVGLQEFQKPQRATFLSAAGSTYGIYPTSTTADPENSIIWRNSTMELVSGSTIDVPYFDGHIRKMPVVLLRHRASGREAYFINVHNPASGVGYGDETANRRKAIAVERAKVAELRSTGRAVFLTGDMNDRAPAFCPLTAGKLMLAPNSIPSMACSMPARDTGIDWVLAAGPARFTRYGYDWTPKNLRLTDHPIVWTRVHLAPNQ
ncbi:peptidoglycan DD-metalloendopeptidase family protein [Marmoricola sp. RAF53]|uniref:peptidoglycan DD-metalloendopeptidase family protein n=1 Tax=Marmoricola sp. RAF53 TaxID=3233059 RepID=UPI003F9B9E61